MIGIIAALDIEARSLKERMEDTSVSSYAGMQFFKGKIFRKDIVVVQSGVGKVNAAACTQILIDKFRVDKVINVGVAGGLAAGLHIGDIVVSDDAVQYDMDARAFGHPRGEIPNMDMTYFPADRNMIRKAESAADRIGTKILVGRIMTADLGLGDTQLKAELVETFKGACCEMEGAAVAQVCYLNGVPYLVIRSISDNADDDANDTYYASIDDSVKPSTDFLFELLQEL
ncbi:MAG: 5'-methylthioadenosine/adenosylhomocysteine nucleosidase [Eubacteriaceae bacterium]|jgi:adenosylhomocysteine nucleosidase